MDKIDFVNETQPAINDTNLNLMQDNIERAINAQVSGDTLPIGTILPYAGTSIPDNWLECTGAAISRTTYSQLFNVIGTTYGVGDGSTTFNIPNLKGKIPVGQDTSQTEFNTLGKTGGEKTHTLTIQEIPEHRHNMTPPDPSVVGSGSYWESLGQWCNTYTSGLNSYTEYTGGGNSHNNLQPYVVQRYIIKAFQTAGTVAQILNTDSNSTTNAYSANYTNTKINNVSTTLTTSMKYSTSEKVIGSWELTSPRKNIYRKVIRTGAITSGTTKTIAHEISNLDLVLDIKGTLYVNNEYYMFPRIDAENLVHFVSVKVGSSNIIIYPGSDAQFSDSYVILEYTKTS